MAGAGHTAHAVRAQLPLTRVFLVSMLARRELREHDWQWIVCGARGADGVAQYTRCRAGSDPDVAAGRNGENVDVLDLHIRELVVTPDTRSCYSFDDGWAAGCATQDTHTYDAAWEWAPRVGAHAGPVWAYTWFLLGESDACREHGCDESAAMVATLPPVRSHRLVLLPWRATCCAGHGVHMARASPTAVLYVSRGHGTHAPALSRKSPASHTHAAASVAYMPAVVSPACAHAWHPLAVQNVPRMHGSHTEPCANAPARHGTRRTACASAPTCHTASRACGFTGRNRPGTGSRAGSGQTTADA